MWVMLMAMMNVAEDLIQPLLVSMMLWSGGIERMDEGSKELNLSSASLTWLWMSVIAMFGVRHGYAQPSGEIDSAVAIGNNGGKPFTEWKKTKSLLSNGTKGRKNQKENSSQTFSSYQN
ncbi:hypothetical protein QOT17_015394 [Balamuthia mandrillaris]